MANILKSAFSIQVYENLFFFFQAEDGIRDLIVTGVQTCALPISLEETFTPFVFAERLQGTRAAIKKAIMDQRRVAGVGNIYANEALFEAGIDPSKPDRKSGV